MARRSGSSTRGSKVSNGRPTRWAERASVRAHFRELRRETILEAAAASFGARGYHATTMGAIARQLGVSKAALYYYVQNKEELLVEIQRTGFDRMIAGLDELLAGDVSGAEILRRVMVRYGEWITTEFGTCVVTHFNVALSPEIAPRLRDARRILDRRVRDVIARGIGDGSIRSCDPRVIASAMFGAFNWLAFWYDGARHGPSPAGLAEQYMAAFIDGIGTAARRRRR